MLEHHLKLYRSLNRNKVKYLVVGGVACGIYGSPRATLDIDVFVEPTLNNIKKLLDSLEEAGLGTASLTTPEKILANEVNIFEDYLKLDIFTKVKGMEFNDVWRNREKVSIKGVPVNVVSIDGLIRSKLASKRIIDLEDVKILKKIKRLR